VEARGQGVSWPPLEISFAPSHFNVYKAYVYCRVWVAIMHHQRHSLHLLGYAQKLTRLCLAVPVSSATAERSFSTLRALKTFTRSTMNTSRLVHLALLHFHHDCTDIMDLNDLCQTFTRRRPKEHRERVSLANRQHYLHVRSCAEL